MKKRQKEVGIGDAMNLSVPFREAPPGLEERILAALPPQRKPSPKRNSWAWGTLAAAAILVLAVGNIVQWMAPRPSVALRPGLMVVMLDGTSFAPKAFGTIVLDPVDNHGILAVRDLPKPSGGQYQLWLKKDGELHSAGVFGVDNDGYGSLVLTVPPDFRGFREFLLSKEPQGGSFKPTLPEVMKGRY